MPVILRFKLCTPDGFQPISLERQHRRGINNTIKVIKRRAYGYRDQEYFFLKIRAAFPVMFDEPFSGCAIQSRDSRMRGWRWKSTEIVVPMRMTTMQNARTATFMPQWSAIQPMAIMGTMLPM